MDGQDHRNFERLATLLLALADLADCAGSRSLAVRCLVLWILWPAEAVARAYAEAVTGASVPAADAHWTEETLDEASRLAQSLRVLAALFHTLAFWARLAQKRLATPRGLLLRRPIGDRRLTIAAFLARPIDSS